MTTMIGKTITSLSKIEPKTDDEKDQAIKVRTRAEALLDVWKKISKKEKKEQSSKKQSGNGDDKQKKPSTTVNNSTTNKHPQSPNANHSSANTTTTTTNNTAASSSRVQAEIEPFIPQGMQIETGVSYRTNMRKKFIAYMQMLPQEMSPEEEMEYKERAAWLGKAIED